MAFDWKEYLVLAKHLHQSNIDGLNKEACGRSAISRAYYAAFCHARNYAHVKRGFKPKYDETDHREVREHFRNSRTKGVASALDSLRQWRNTADYNDEFEGILEEIDERLTEASDIFTWIKPDPPKAS